MPLSHTGRQDLQGAESEEIRIKLVRNHSANFVHRNYGMSKLAKGGFHEIRAILRFAVSGHGSFCPAAGTAAANDDSAIPHPADIPGRTAETYGADAARH